MSPGLEPSFTAGGPIWQLAGMGSVDFEPDDPGLVIPAGALERGARDSPERPLLAGLDGDIPSAPAEPMRPPQVAARGWPAKWRLALAASFLLHAAVALSLMKLDNHAAAIEGAELSGIAFHGNASEDQISDGAISETREPAVDVTMITMLEARPVATVEAEMLPADEIAQAAEVVGVEKENIETVQPVNTAAARPVEASDAQPVESVTAEAAPMDAAESVETTMVPPAPSAEWAPAILAADRAEPVEHDNIARKSPEALPTQPVESFDTAQQKVVESAVPERVEVATAGAVEPELAESPTRSEKTETSRSSRVEPDTVRPGETETSDISDLLSDVVSPPLPEAKPAAAGQQPARKEPATRPREFRKGKTAAAKPVAKAKKTGNGGSGQADSRRGQADGRNSGTAASSSRGGKSSAAGNAAVSNYPGKVATRLRRSLRYPAAAKRQRLRGQVHVSFVVAANGSVGSVRVVASSGSPILDKAALDTVRRAAPFPAIPDGAGRSSWPFTVPLAFSR